MSWSVSYIGKPEAIKRKLVEESARLTGQSKEEFDSAKPALDNLLDQNLENGVVQLNAHGHATITDGVKTYGNCGGRVENYWNARGIMIRRFILRCRKFGHYNYAMRRWFADLGNMRPKFEKRMQLELEAERRRVNRA